MIMKRDDILSALQLCQLCVVAIAAYVSYNIHRIFLGRGQALSPDPSSINLLRNLASK